MSFASQMLYMTRDHMKEIPEFDVPPGYSFSILGDEGFHHWYKLHRRSEPVLEIYDGLLEEQFGEHLDELRERCIFLMYGRKVAGSAIAWWDPDVYGERWGSLHWFAVHPDFQHSGLARPLLARALRKISESDEKCYLVTYPDRIVAIRLYLELGFRPKYVSETGARVWREVALDVPHEALESLL